MSTIHTLPDYLVSLIAAGEVIERPAYVVKELIENAVDAQASSIRIEIEEGGLQKIKITDNGTGMSTTDLTQCFKIHTTSKIQTEEDLINISSCGFRGEALASICAIADVTIQSRESGESLGNKIEIRQGEAIDPEPVGMAVGTMIQVDHVFSQVPARKKNLKSAQTEFRYISEMIVNLALSYPAVQFAFFHNKKAILLLPVQTEEERLTELFEQKYIESLLPLSFEDSYVRIRGFLSLPQHASSSNQKQFVVINGRVIKDKLISTALKDGFGTLLDSKSYPTGIFFYSIPYELVDVNVHPRKEEVRFTHAKDVYSATIQAVQKTLLEHNVSFTSTSVFATQEKLTRTYAGKLLKDEVLKKEKNISIHAESIIQIHSVYLLAQTEDGMILVDQHAAHERIMFEKFLNAYTLKSKEKKHIRLQKTLTILLSLPDLTIFQEFANVFSEIGFSYTIQKKSVQISAIPELLQDRDIPKIIEEMLADVREFGFLPELDSGTHSMIAYLACRSAIKAGDTVLQTQAKELIEELLITKNYATCPHGRPTMIRVELDDLHKMFKRL